MISKLEFKVIHTLWTANIICCVEHFEIWPSTLLLKSKLWSFVLKIQYEYCDTACKKQWFLGLLIPVGWTSWNIVTFNAFVPQSCLQMFFLRQIFVEGGLLTHSVCNTRNLGDVIYFCIHWATFNDFVNIRVIYVTKNVVIEAKYLG